jgi:hypothetical protein
METGAPGTTWLVFGTAGMIGLSISWLILRLGVVVVERYEFSDNLEEIVDRCLMMMVDKMSCEKPHRWNNCMLRSRMATLRPRFTF